MPSKPMRNRVPQVCKGFQRGMVWVILLGIIALSQAQAGILVFTDKTSFLAATGATSATGALPDLGKVTTPFTVGSVTFNLGPGATELYSGGADDWSTNAPNDVAAFIGVWSDTPFDAVTIRETIGDIENEFFGQFYTGATPVPEASTFFLFGTGFLGLLGYGWKRRKRVV